MAFSMIVGSLLAPSAHAATGNSGNNNFFSGLVEYISQKFGLDKTKVQVAVQEYHNKVKATITPRPAQTPEARQAMEKKRLDVLVNQGKITADQEKAIIAELTALMAKYPVYPNATPDQRKMRMENVQNELTAWAKSQNIDPTVVFPMGARGGWMGRGHRGFRDGDDIKPTPTP